MPARLLSILPEPCWQLVAEFACAHGFLDDRHLTCPRPWMLFDARAQLLRIALISRELHQFISPLLAKHVVVSSLASAEHHLVRLTAEPHLAASARLVSIVGYARTARAIEAQVEDGVVGDVPVEQAVDSAITQLVRTSAAIIALCPSFRVLTADSTYIFAVIHDACFALPATCDILRVMLLQDKNGGMDKLVRVHPHLNRFGLDRFGLGDSETFRSASDAEVDCPRLVAARAQRLSLGPAIDPHTLGPTPQLIEIELHALHEASGARPPRVLKLATLRSATVHVPRHSTIGGYPQGVLGRSLGWAGGALGQLRLILDGPAAHLDTYFGAVRIGPKGTIKSIVIEGDIDPALEGYQAFARICGIAQVSIAVRRTAAAIPTTTRGGKPAAWLSPSRHLVARRLWSAFNREGGSPDPDEL